MNNIDTQYQALLHHIKLTGTKKETRNGSVISTFGRQIRHKMSEGFPLLTTKKMYWKGNPAAILWRICLPKVERTFPLRVCFQVPFNLT